jgi:hypothetical protein
MFNNTRFLALFYLPFLLIGCKPTPVNLLEPDIQFDRDRYEVAKGLSPADREAITKCLPSGIRLDTIASAYGPEDKITVEQELAKLGAIAGKDGKLHDKSGREIAFYHEPAEQGTPWGPDHLKTWNEESGQVPEEELRKKYTVITLTGNPSGIPVP